MDTSDIMFFELLKVCLTNFQIRAVVSGKQIKALNQNGWYRTVEYDVPHWSYVGYPPETLLKLGFQKKVIGKTTYWVTPL